jgi:8-oxo-dGTP pyrophosphatase MutT (NUDIX family)
MSLLRHLDHCNRFDASRFRPLLFKEQRIGLVRDDNAARLAHFPDTFAVAADKVTLVASGGFDAVSAAVDRVVEALVAEGAVSKWRYESFAVSPAWGETPLFKIDRGAVPVFGIRAYGVHLNGWRRAPNGRIQLWIGRRAGDKKVDPNKLDNLVAGGIGYPHGIEDTLIKEAEEEAGMDAALVARATACGHIAYRMEWESGARDDVLFVYELETPGEFVPRNHDGEIVEFELMDITDVLDRIEHTDDFKFNVNLVIIDFALRHGLIAPNHPEYAALRSGLRPVTREDCPSH